MIEKTRTAVTDDQGQYKLVGLTPGEYLVTFTLAGFGTVKREGVALTDNFTSSLNIDMKVGSIEETVTVSGESPTVDVHNVVQQNVLSRELFDEVPSGKTIPAYAAMTPGVSIPPTSQDVGGSKGEISVRMVAHGGREGDQRLLQDGMRTNSAEGSGRGFFANPANAQEITIDLGGGTAENELGGVQMNVVPKDGGNRYSGYGLFNYTNNRLQSDNLTSELIARGLTKVNGVNEIWDANGAFGGPIRERRALVLHGTPIVGEFEPRRRGVREQDAAGLVLYAGPRSSGGRGLQQRSALASAHMAGIADEARSTCRTTFRTTATVTGISGAGRCRRRRRPSTATSPTTWCRAVGASRCRTGCSFRPA